MTRECHVWHSQSHDKRVSDTLRVPWHSKSVRHNTLLSWLSVRECQHLECQRVSHTHTHVCVCHVWHSYSRRNLCQFSYVHHMNSLCVRECQECHVWHSYSKRHLCLFSYVQHMNSLCVRECHTLSNTLTLSDICTHSHSLTYMNSLCVRECWHMC